MICASFSGVVLGEPNPQFARFSAHDIVHARIEEVFSAVKNLKSDAVFFDEMAAPGKGLFDRITEEASLTLGRAKCAACEDAFKLFANRSWSRRSFGAG